jgi:hypothetical protein
MGHNMRTYNRGVLASRVFYFTAAIILFVTGAAKIYGARGPADVLQIRDAVFGIQFNYLLLTVGLIELCVGWLCMKYARCARLGTQTAIVLAGLSTNLLVYRIGLEYLHWQRPCPCLGNLTDGIGLSLRVVNIVLKVIVAYLLSGSYITLLWFWRQRKMATTSAPM